MLTLLNNMTPLGVIALLALTLYTLVKQRTVRQQVHAIESNHLSGLPDMEKNIERLVTLQEQEIALLQAINNGVVTLLARKP